MQQKENPSTEPEVYADFEDFQAFENQSGLNKKEMFEPQYVRFMQWFKADIHSRYSKKELQRIELKNVIILVTGYLGMFACYLVLHSRFSQYAWAWGSVLFVAALYFSKKGDVMHMRTHSPLSMTGVAWVDKAIDYCGLGLTGLSPSLFGRRHLAEHFNDVGIVSKLFSKVNLSFEKLPVSYYLRPWMLVQFLLDEEFLKSERINRKTLLIETIGFYIYMVALFTELYFGSYFLLVYHLIPGLLLAGSQLLGALFIHSSIDPRNSFESNALFDWHTAEGLFKVPLFVFSFFNNGLFVNHSIHHAYPQAPMELINKDYRRYHQHILSTCKGVRYNRVLSMRIQKPLLDRLNPPNAFDYIVAFFFSLLALFTMILTIMGLPIPPTIFELLLVDYRIYFVSTRAERALNRVKFMESIRLEERYQQTQNPNTYLKFTYKNYLGWKARAEKQASTQGA